MNNNVDPSAHSLEADNFNLLVVDQPKVPLTRLDEVRLSRRFEAAFIFGTDTVDTLSAFYSSFEPRRGNKGIALN